MEYVTMYANRLAELAIWLQCQSEHGQYVFAEWLAELDL